MTMATMVPIPAPRSSPALNSDVDPRFPKRSPSSTSNWKIARAPCSAPGIDESLHARERSSGELAYEHLCLLPRSVIEHAIELPAPQDGQDSCAPDRVSVVTQHGFHLSHVLSYWDLCPFSHPVIPA